MLNEPAVLVDREFLDELDGNTIPVRARTERDLHQACVEDDRVRAQERNRIAERVRAVSCAMAPGIMADLIEAGAL